MGPEQAEVAEARARTRQAAVAAGRQSLLHPAMLERAYLVQQPERVEYLLEEQVAAEPRE